MLLHTIFYISIISFLFLSMSGMGSVIDQETGKWYIECYSAIEKDDASRAKSIINLAHFSIKVYQKLYGFTPLEHAQKKQKQATVSLLIHHPVNKEDSYEAFYKAIERNDISAMSRYIGLSYGLFKYLYKKSPPELAEELGNHHLALLLNTKL
jgi:hypothetical protein